MIDAFTRGVQTGEPFRAEVRFISRDGEEVWILGEARLIRDDAGRFAYFQGVGFDITPTKRAQEMMAEAARLRAEIYAARNVELAELNEQLRVAIEQAEAAEALQRQLLAREREVVERLTQLDRDKNDFVSSVSHELRTPVTSMLGLPGAARPTATRARSTPEQAAHARGHPPQQPAPAQPHRGPADGVGAGGDEDAAGAGPGVGAGADRVGRRGHEPGHDRAGPGR